MLNRLELVGETLRAALNELAAVAPDWLRGRRPEGLVRALRPPGRGRAPAAGRGRARGLRAHRRRGRVRAARPARTSPPRPRVCGGCRRWRCCGRSGPATSCARAGRLPAAACGSGPRTSRRPPATEPVESPYDTQARFRTRSGTSWTGYIVHLTETCDDDSGPPDHARDDDHRHRARGEVHRRDPPALAGKGLAPGEHLVDAAYVDAELLVRSREEHGIDLVGPPRGNPTWQTKVEGGYTIDRFEVDWEHERVRCPQGKLSSAWSPQVDHAGTPYVSVMFRKADCGACPARAPVHAGRAPGPAPEAAAAGGVRGAQGGPGAARDEGGPAPPTPGGPGSRARSRKGCARSACAAAATAGWPGPISSTSRPRPRSTSSVSAPGSGRSRAPPPAPPASPPSPPDPISPADPPRAGAHHHRKKNVGPHLGQRQQRSTSAAGDRSEVERFWVT